RITVLGRWVRSAAWKSASAAGSSTSPTTTTVVTGPVVQSTARTKVAAEVENRGTDPANASSTACAASAYRGPAPSAANRSSVSAATAFAPGAGESITGR